MAMAPDDKGPGKPPRPSISINSLVRSLKMSQTKKRTPCTLSEPDFHMPGWDKKQREDFFEGIKMYGLKKLKKLQRHIGTKTQEDVRIATELYKKEVRSRELSTDMERQIEEAGLTNEDYKTWFPFYMVSQASRGDSAPLPVAALEEFLEQNAPPVRPPAELSFPNWRRAEIQDFLAIIEIGPIITNVGRHIPTKTELEITGATDAYSIICDARKHALEHGRLEPTYDDLKPGFIYLQCIVGSLSENEKLKQFKIPPNTEPDMARAQFVLKEWLMPNCGAIPNGWTKDEKYALVVAIETYGQHDLLRIQSYFPNKTRIELRIAINALREEFDCKEAFYEKSSSDRYLSLVSWGSTLTQCKEKKHQVIAADRLIFALKELPEPDSKEDLKKIYSDNLTDEESSAAIRNLCMLDAKRKGAKLEPLLRTFVEGIKQKLGE